jgi:hypothetical protein
MKTMEKSAKRCHLPGVSADMLGHPGHLSIEISDKPYRKVLDTLMEIYYMLTAM